MKSPHLFSQLIKYLSLFLFLSWAISVIATPVSYLSKRDIFSPVIAQLGMVVTSDDLATQIGVDVLKQGGNAVDAAVTIGFVMAVTYPQAGNIGGGGFMLIYLAATQQVMAIDYRETAPAKADENLFIDETGQVNAQLSRFSHLAVGVPGTVAGLALALEKYGSLSLAQTLAPAIAIAKNGFPVSRRLSQAICDKIHHSFLGKNAASRQIFLKSDGTCYQPGELLVQPALAATLTLIAEQGTNAFYQGKIADLIVKEMTAHQGLITKTDLANYRPLIRQPVHGTYRGYDIYSMSPPSAGGVALIQLLNILESDNIQQLGHNSAATIHLMTEAMKRAYADRAKYLGDPDFVNIPLAGLLAKKYATRLRQEIDPHQATPSHQLSNSKPLKDESPETTHYSVIDHQGNAVANTYTLNFSFGTGIMVPNAGFLLNNQMDDFSAPPGVLNAYGLVGGTANAIAPQKRMLSSMSPTIILKANQPFLITGSPGGSQIITTTLQVIMNVIDHQMNIQEAVNAVRIHHQWLPDELRIEEGLSADTINLLREKGHQIVIKRAMGAASSIFIDNHQKPRLFHGAADPRRGGLALGQ
jgi:gamma-glutamyltranspeptidase/glutathione hydrolase